MAHEVCKYRLTETGTIPEFIYTGENSLSGEYIVVDNAQPSPRDVVLVGITTAGATSLPDTTEFTVFSTKEEFEAYLSSQVEAAGWADDDPDNPGDPDATVPFDVSAHAQRVWDARDALNAA